MKRIFGSVAFALTALLLCHASSAAGADTNLASLLQQGLFEEEANRDLNAAVARYQSLAVRFDEDRQIAATAVFRLGECYRKLGRNPEAAAEYKRILSEFPDQSTLATLSRQNLLALGNAVDATPNKSVSESTVGHSDRNAEDSDQEIRRIQALLRESPDLINAPGPGGQTLLQSAAAKGEFTVCRFLLDHGAAVDGAQRGQLTALHYAAGNGNKAIVDLLLSCGADPGATTPSGVTPLHLAAEKGYAQVARSLIAARAPLNAATTSSANRDLNGIRYEFQIRDRPLTVAVSKGSVDVAKMLIEAGADLQALDGSGKPPLIKAVENGDKVIEQFLLEHGANVDARDSSHQTALHWAATRPEMIGALLAHHADVNARDSSGRTPLHSAVDGSGETNAVELLLAHGADVNARDSAGQSALLLAVSHRALGCVSLLLKAKADPNLPSSSSSQQGWTPLHVATELGESACAELLLKSGADPNLHMATTYPTVQFANEPYPRASDGTPLLIAACNNQSNLVQLLLRFKANPNLPGRTGWTPLHFAVENTKMTTAADVLAHGADVNATNLHGDTPLHLAVLVASSELVELLLTHKADPNIRNNAQLTPLELAKGRRPIPQPISSLSTSLDRIINLLHAHGALDTLPDWNKIQVCRPSAGFSQSIFSRGTNDWNRFTLLELVAVHYRFLNTDTAEDKSSLRFMGRNNILKFPDLTRVLIHRASPDGKMWKTIPVNLEQILESGDCSRDPWLQWGDSVEIPETDHRLNDAWQGWGNPGMSNLLQCVSRSFHIIVQGADAPFHPVLNSAPSFMLRSVLDQSKLIRFSSDLSRVKVTRSDPVTGRKKSWVLDCSQSYTAPDFWLRDSDVIEVPEK